MDAVEGHPIPQDVTGFQFRLIGDITVKQFVYLATGALLTWIIFIVSMPFILKFLLGTIVAGSALILTFLPIDGRPADTMFTLFLRALGKPTQYMYKKQSQEEALNSTVATKIQTPTPIVIPTPVEEKKNETISEKPLEEMQKQEDEVKKEVTEINEKLKVAEQQASQPTNNLQEENEAHEKAIELEKQLSESLAQKQQLEERLVLLEKKLSEKPEEPAMKPGEQTSTTVTNIPDPLKVSTGAPIMPDVPNMISGIVKDARGNVLPNIMIEIKDAQNNPVRAFKTNNLGQFVSATPLLNGTYTVTFEDPKKLQKFDKIQIVANGTAIQPLEVKSTDAREDLRKELFNA